MTTYSKKKMNDLKQAEEFNASKGWFENLKKRFALKSQQEKQVLRPRGSRWIPRRHLENHWGEGYLPEQVFNADVSVLACEKKNATKNIY